MSEHDRGQVALSAAEIYDEFFVPALFADWPAKVLDAAKAGPGDRILDVACGTGVLALAAKELAGTDGQVVGLDVNDGMLAVARSKSAGIAWESGPAESLPYAVDSFDRVVSQFGLMFFQDRSRAIAEMLRVVRPGGNITVAVWASLGDTPGYAAVAAMLSELFGAEIAKSIEAPYSLGDIDTLKRLFADAGAKNAVVHTVDGKARFASLDAWVYTDIKGWTLADVIDDDSFEDLRQQAPKWLSRFVQADGSVEFPAPAHIVTIAT